MTDTLFVTFISYVLIAGIILLAAGPPFLFFLLFFAVNVLESEVGF